MQDTDLDDALARSRGSEPRRYDGVAELWWDSIDDLVGAAVSEEVQIAQQLLPEDERRFIDVASSPIWGGDRRDRSAVAEVIQHRQGCNNRRGGFAAIGTELDVREQTSCSRAMTPYAFRL
jgi:EthD domain